jgi:GAF domain-containing protein
MTTLESTETDSALVLAGTAKALAQPAGLPALLQRIVDLAVECIPACELASATLSNDGLPLTSVATSELAAQADRVQAEVGEGPSVAVMTADRPSHTDDIVNDERWPALASHWIALGIASALACPLVVTHRGGTLRGSLTFYASAGAAFDTAQRNLAAALAAQAALALATAFTELEAGVRDEQLREAIESRDMIGQAKGILMASEGCTADAAFDVLRRASQRENLKLRDIAARLVASHAPGPRQTNRPDLP